MLFGIFAAIGRAILGTVRAVASVIGNLVSVVKAAAMSVVRQIGIQTIGRASPMLDLMLFNHIHWMQALRGQEDFDEEMARLNDEMGDDDGNGIPDLYDEEVTSPGEDFLHIKFPTPLLRENDYVAFMPRAVGALGFPVAPGMKGLVRGVDLIPMGQFVGVKWNALNPRGPVGAFPITANAMDLLYLGHVY
jgi:hypothetical protein